MPSFAAVLSGQSDTLKHIAPYFDASSAKICMHDGEWVLRSDAFVKCNTVDEAFKAGDKVSVPPNPAFERTSRRQRFGFVAPSSRRAAARLICPPSHARSVIDVGRHCRRMLTLYAKNVVETLSASVLKQIKDAIDG